MQHDFQRTDAHFPGPSSRHVTRGAAANIRIAKSLALSFSLGFANRRIVVETSATETSLRVDVLDFNGGR